MKSLNKRKALLFLLSVIIVISTTFVFLSFTCLNNKDDKATVIMTLNYENSSAGLNPDNSKFNLRSFKDSEVLTVALTATDMSSKLSPNELASFIKMEGVSAKPIDINADSKYIDSTYEITLVLPEEYARFVTAEKLLNEICVAYKEWFIANYVVDSKALIVNTDDFEDMDYRAISNYLDMMMVRGKNYLNRKEESATAFTGEDGTTWKSLRQELSNLTDYDLSTFNRYIWENGISKDKAWAITILKHENDDLIANYDLHSVNIKKYNSVVNEYRNEMTTSVLIPTYDNSGQFYLSRTKTGIDDVFKVMDDYLEEASTLKEKASLNSDRIEKLKDSKVTNTEKADMMLQNIQFKITDIFGRIQDLDAEYANEKADGYIQFIFIEENIK